jgi:hypothetical protein
MQPDNAAGTSRLLIVTGGQSGVDRAALDAALTLTIPYAGYCPHGGWAEDLLEPPGLLAHYPNLRETPLADPAQRTEWNVRDSDALLILTAGSGVAASPGTVRAIEFAAHETKPVLVLSLAAPDALEQGGRWLEGRLAAIPDDATLRLGIGGPRESEAPGIYAKASALLREVLRGR